MTANRDGVPYAQVGHRVRELRSPGIGHPWSASLIDAHPSDDPAASASRQRARTVA
jgi:hypothetical protein